MTSVTHRQYSICFALVFNMFIYAKGITEINYYLAIPIMLLIGKYAALFPDVDHIWKNVKDKTISNFIINKLIHVTGGHHRSWQTHSIDIVAVYSMLAFLLPGKLFELEKISTVNKEVLSIIMVGFASGWISHIIADMMTSAGVRLFCWNKKLTIKLVPKHIGKLRFNTGHEWEAFCYKTTRIINIIIGVVALIYPLILNGTIPRAVATLTEAMFG